MFSKVTLEHPDLQSKGANAESPSGAVEYPEIRYFHGHHCQMCCHETPRPTITHAG